MSLDSTQSNGLPDIAFIVGMGRSGTTLLTNMLNSNPSLIATPENEFILFLFSHFKDKNFSDIKVVDEFVSIFELEYNQVLSFWKPSGYLKDDILNLKEKTFANACKLVYLNYPFANKNKNAVSCVIDKNPIYSLHLKKLNQLYPNAKYIVITRDYRDNILSRRTYSDLNSSLIKLAVSWNYFYKKIEEDTKALHLNCHYIRYEDLVTDPERVLTDICVYLGVSYSSNMLHFQDLSKNIKEHIQATATKEKYKKISSMHSNLEKEIIVDRMNAYINKFTPEEVNLLDAICKKYGDKFNYSSLSSAQISVFEQLKYFIYNLYIAFYYSFSNWVGGIPLPIRRLFLKPKK